MPLIYTTALVTIGTDQWETVTDFYRQLFVKPDLYQPPVYAEFQLSGLRLGIFRPKIDHKAEFSQSQASSFSLCLEVEALDSAIAILTDLGYPPPGEMLLAPYGREIYTYDPIGNRLILYQKG